jgi:hypothetical protein
MMRPMMAFCVMALAAGAAWAAAPGGTAAPNNGEPTLVTLHYDNAPAATVFKDLGRQIGRECTNSSGGLEGMANVSIQAEKEPYWQVMAKISDAMGISTNLRRNGKINVSPGGRNGVRVIAGPVMMFATTVRHDANFTNPEQPNFCAITLSVHFEPNLAVALFSGRVIPEVAVDERGNSLVPAPGSAAARGGRSGMRGGFGGVGDPGMESDMRAIRPDFESTSEIVLAPPGNAGYRIAHVKGKLQVKVVEKAKTIEIPAADFAKTRSVDFRGANLSVSAITNTAPAGATAAQPYRISLNMNRGALSAEEWTNVSALLDAATVDILDAKDVAYSETGGGRSGSTTSKNVSFSLQASQGPALPEPVGPPAKCRIVLPEALRDIAVPFEFKDLPLP